MVINIRKCFKEPTKFRGFGKTITHILAVDENGSTGNLEYIRKQNALGKDVDINRIFFTVTGCLYTRKEYDSNLFLLQNLKNNFGMRRQTMFYFIHEI